jgi:hypothetical protein
MDKPNSEDLSNFHRYFAIQCNNDFWSLSEADLSQDDKQNILTIAHASLFHWREAGTEENIQLANLAVARAYCVNKSYNSVLYAKQAFDYFDGHGEAWVQAFTNAVLSHSFHIAGDFEQSKLLYERAVSLQSQLSEGDRKVFDATFNRIPDPRGK